MKRGLIDGVSISAIREIVNSDTELKKIWDYSVRLFPNLKRHYTVPVDNREVEYRIRLLVVAETYFIKKEVDRILREKRECSYADVGDSDGSVRLMLKECFYGDKLKSIGINLQQSAVNKMKAKGLEGIRADALSLGHQGINYDIVSVFETLEHLPNPIEFLKGIRTVTNVRLVVSVPFIRHSRVGLSYISDKWPKKWPKDKKPTVENTHIFELSPTDWEKIFLHTGWKIGNQWKLMMFPPNKLSRLIMQPFWRFVSFEGFWFVSLHKYSKYSAKYVIE